MRLPTLVLFFRFVLSVKGPLKFHMDFRMDFSISHKVLLGFWYRLHCNQLFLCIHWIHDFSMIKMTGFCFESTKIHVFYGLCINPSSQNLYISCAYLTKFRKYRNNVKIKLPLFYACFKNKNLCIDVVCTCFF